MTKFNVMNLQDVTTESHFCQTQAYNSTTHLHIWYVLSAYLQLYQLSVIKIHNQLGLRWRWPYAYRPYTVGLYTICRQILSIKMKPNVTLLLPRPTCTKIACPVRLVVSSATLETRYQAYSTALSDTVFAGDCTARCQ